MDNTSYVYTVLDEMNTFTQYFLFYTFNGKFIANLNFKSSKIFGLASSVTTTIFDLEILPSSLLELLNLDITTQQFKLQVYNSI